MAPVELILYVSPSSIPSTRARRELDHVLSSCDARTFRLEVIHLDTRDPRQAAMIARDHVLATPLLVKQAPPPSLRLVGDLTDDNAVALLLLSAGLSFRGSGYRLIVDRDAQLALDAAPDADRLELMARLENLASFRLLPGSLEASAPVSTKVTEGDVDLVAMLDVRGHAVVVRRAER